MQNPAKIRVLSGLSYAHHSCRQVRIMERSQQITNQNNRLFIFSILAGIWVFMFTPSYPIMFDRQFLILCDHSLHYFFFLIFPGSIYFLWLSDSSALCLKMAARTFAALKFSFRVNLYLVTFSVGFLIILWKSCTQWILDFRRLVWHNPNMILMLAAILS